MENKQYLTFRLHNLQYGIEATLVQEMFPLPELKPLPEAPSEIIGILNVRGQIIPIIHLDLLQGSPVKGCHLSDYVVIMQWDGVQFGMVVHQVSEVLELHPEAIETEASSELLSHVNTAFVAGVAKVDASNIILLDPKTLIGQPDTILTLIWDAQMQIEMVETFPINEMEQLLDQNVSEEEEQLEISKVIPSFYDLYCPDATPEEQAIFRQRADTLQQAIEVLKVAKELMNLAVVGWDNEYFGLNLELVREFTDMSNLTPIPCCPKHIVGNMNLRGEIVTLVDIRNILNLPTPPVSVGSPVVVVEVDDIVAGLPVEQVWEMASLNAADITPLPAASSALNEQYFQGTIFYQEKMLKVLDISKLFAQGELVVDEQV